MVAAVGFVRGRKRASLDVMQLLMVAVVVPSLVSCLRRQTTTSFVVRPRSTSFGPRRHKVGASIDLRCNWWFPGRPQNSTKRKKAELAEDLVKDWQSIASRDRVTERVRKLETSRVDAEKSLEALVAAAELDVAAIERDWERLRRECAYMKAPEALRVVRDALVVAYAAHSGQKRKSGEPFIIHPVEVASLLAGLRMDVDCVAAGLLHDTVEDTPVTFEQLEARYGRSLRQIVEGETKVSKLPKLAMSTSRAPADEDDDWRTLLEDAPPPARHVVDDDLGAASPDLIAANAHAVKNGFKPVNPVPRNGARKPQKAAPVGNEDDAFSLAESQAENLRQMFIAMTEDVRIIIVKLADRLHNMRTLEHMPTHKQRKIARETLEIFAPLAHRLGIWQFKAELEELSFRYAHPREYAALTDAIAARAERYERALAGSKAELERSLGADDKLGDVTVSVSGRTKELYSLWLKLRKMAAVAGDDQNLHFDVDKVQDVVALRVVLDVPRLSAAEPSHRWRLRSAWMCYHALCLVQQLHGCDLVPEHGVKDYISFPKPNGYQCVHVFVRRQPEDQIVEIQILDKFMHDVAEHGMAAHWLYKDAYYSPTKKLTAAGVAAPANGRDFNNTSQYKVEWLDSVKTWQHEISSPNEFIDTIRREIIGKRVFVFLRDGKIIDLSKGATVLDAAFHIHTDVGLRAVTAYINGNEEQLSYELRNGDVISIETDPSARPQLDWMRWARRRSTRAKLRAYFKAQEKRAQEKAPLTYHTTLIRQFASDTNTSAPS